MDLAWLFYSTLDQSVTFCVEAFFNAIIQNNCLVSIILVQLQQIFSSAQGNGFSFFIFINRDFMPRVPFFYIFIYIIPIRFVYCLQTFQFLSGPISPQLPASSDFVESLSKKKKTWKPILFSSEVYLLSSFPGSSSTFPKTW